MFVMSTAGHIDHGKSTLVQAMTGIDPDRLREEKERGMTIDLGFAWLKLPSGREVGIVDVPGHERFVGNMLAGVGGIDLTMIVIAANESVMPQTKEHVAILDLLNIKKGVVAVTKKDLVDEEWLTLVKMDIEELLKPTTLTGSPIMPVSAITREGIPDLLKAIDKILETTEPRKDLGRPRLPIDRIFTIPGSGTVVTGTLIDGSLEVGQEVEIAPKGLKSRIRALQIHKTKVESTGPGTRVAANITGVSVTEIERGDVLTRPGLLKPTSILSGKLRMLDYVPRPLRHSTEVTFYTGATETLAKVRLLENDEIKPGTSGWAQFVLDKPITAVDGDHFVIRSTTDTLGGGKIVDAHASQLRRRKEVILNRLQIKDEGSTEDVLYALLETRQPVEIGSLAAQSKVPATEFKNIIDELIKENRVIMVGQGDSRLLLTSPGWEGIKKKAEDYLQEYHKKFPVRPGMPKEELRNKLKLGSASVPVVAKLISSNVITEAGADVRLNSFQITLTLAQKNVINAYLITLINNPYNPPSEGIPEPELLNYLIGQNKVVKISEDVIFSVTAYNEAVGKITGYLKTHEKATLAELRDMLITSRKYATSLLENMDARKITKRVEDGKYRVLVQG
jgi:selenocysteine-specific elongation factor